MSNPYLEIHKTYWSAFFSSWIGVVWLIGGLGCIVGSFAVWRSDSFTSGVGPVSYFVLGSCFTNWMLWHHFRTLVVNLNRRLFPRSIAANVVVFAGFAVVVAILWPAMLQPTLPQAFPLIAFALAWFAFTGWLFLMASPILFMAGLGLYFWFGFYNFAPFDGPLLAFLQGNHLSAASLLAIAAVAAITLIIAGMIRLSPDSPRFNRAYTSGTYHIRAHVTGETNQAWIQQSGLRLNLYLGAGRSVYIPSTNSLWNRAKRWRQLNRGLVGSMIFLVVMINVVQIALSRGAHTTPMITQWTIWFIMMPLMFICFAWLGQWRFLEIELLRPVERHRFLHDLALAVAVDFLQCSAILLIPSVLLNSLLWHFAMSGGFVAFVIASLIFNYAMMVWMLRLRTIAGILLGCMICIAMEIPLDAFTEEAQPFQQHLALAGCAVLILAAVFLLRDARRRWLVMELG